MTCAISVDAQTVYLMNKKYVITFDFKRKNMEIRDAVFHVTLDDHDLDSCVLHLRKDYERYVFFLQSSTDIIFFMP